jgi:hypothetical protein
VRADEGAGRQKGAKVSEPKTARRSVAIATAALVLTFSPALSSAATTPTWPDFRADFLKKHRHFLPAAPPPLAEGITRAWVDAQARYFRARSRALTRVRKAYLRLMAATSTAAPSSPAFYVPSGALRTAIERAFGSEATHAFAVVECENPTLNAKAIHYNGDGTSDWGLFQINIVYNAGAFDYAEHLLDPWYNIQVAANIYRSRGWGDWTCGRLLGLG